MTKPEFACKKPYPLGARAESDAVYFSFVSKERDCGILIYDRTTGKRLQKLSFTQDERVGNIYCKRLADVKPEEIAYQFYEGDEIVPDRHARMFCGRAAYGRERKPQGWRALIPCDEFDWGNDDSPRIPYGECVCYCAHVRGFTRHASSGVAHRGTFRGMMEKLDYLQKTGITTVELQPVYEFAEMPTDAERKVFLAAQNPAYMASDEEMDMLFPQRCNYWGYKRGYYYAPKAAYAAGENPCLEFKEMVRAFHERGMEIVMQFYFPQSVKTLEITEILKFWVLEYHVDGFHLMGENLPVNLIAADELLAETKLWYYYFDTKQIYGADGAPQYVNLASYGDDFLYAMRKYLKGDENMLGEALSQMRRIPRDMGRIHYMSNYYGFTLMDMVSYDRKHNEANGEDNRDGNDFNYSWNCGEEGACRRRKVRSLRHKQIKNAMVMLLFAQSTPLIFMGDEFGNSQKGNNNPYCQDNGVTWLDWNDLRKNEDIYDFWSEMVRLRKEHPILHPMSELRLMDYLSCGYPDLSYHGQSAWRPRTESCNRHVGVMYCGKYARRGGDEEDDFLYLAMNMYWEPMELAMPRLPAGMKWQLVRNTEESAGVPDMSAEETAMETAAERPRQEQRAESASEKVIFVPGRSCSIYVSVPDEAERKRTKRGGRAKARAAGRRDGNAKARNAE